MVESRILLTGVCKHYVFWNASESTVDHLHGRFHFSFAVFFGISLPRTRRGDKTDNGGKEAPMSSPTCNACKLAGCRLAPAFAVSSWHFHPSSSSIIRPLFCTSRLLYWRVEVTGKKMGGENSKTQPIGCTILRTQSWIGRR